MAVAQASAAEGSLRCRQATPAAPEAVHRQRRVRLSRPAQATARLLANQSDIGNAVQPFYGPANGSHLTALLTRHILLAAKILAEAKAGTPRHFR